jgi:hypothetical protein
MKAVTRTIQAIVVLSTVAGPAPAQNPGPGPARIILIRHAEKPADAKNLTCHRPA